MTILFCMIYNSFPAINAGQRSYNIFVKKDIGITLGYLIFILHLIAKSVPRVYVCNSVQLSQFSYFFF